MMTLPGKWNDVGSRSAAAGALRDESAPVSVQRCLPVNGAQQPAIERRAGARTQLGMPAVTLPPSEPLASERRPAHCGKGAAGTSSAPPRRSPPPLPARFATPKVVVAATPLLATVPARRLQLQDVTCELDAAALLPLRAPPLPTPGRSARTRTSRRSAPPRGVRGLMASLLVQLLSLVAPSLQVQPSRHRDD
jgi:hypothetical protein